MAGRSQFSESEDKTVPESPTSLKLTVQNAEEELLSRAYKLRKKIEGKSTGTVPATKPVTAKCETPKDREVDDSGVSKAQGKQEKGEGSAADISDNDESSLPPFEECCMDLELAYHEMIGDLNDPRNLLYKHFHEHSVFVIRYVHELSIIIKELSRQNKAMDSVLKYLKIQWKKVVDELSKAKELQKKSETDLDNEKIARQKAEDAVEVIESIQAKKYQKEIVELKRKNSELEHEMLIAKNEADNNKKRSNELEDQVLSLNTLVKSYEEGYNEIVRSVCSPHKESTGKNPTTGNCIQCETLKKRKLCDSIVSKVQGKRVLGEGSEAYIQDKDIPAFPLPKYLEGNNWMDVDLTDPQVSADLQKAALKLPEFPFHTLSIEQGQNIISLFQCASVVGKQITDLKEKHKSELESLKAQVKKAVDNVLTEAKQMQKKAKPDLEQRIFVR